MTATRHGGDGTQTSRISVAGIQQAFQSATYTPAELIEALLQQVGDDDLHAFISLNEEAASTAGIVADADVGSERASGLEGIPIALKDNFATADLATTAGSAALGHWIADQDAAVVTALRRAGATFIGKTNMDEFAYGPLGLGSNFGTPRNPVDASRVTGGSSSGSAAAVAAGFCAAALGTDTAGSVRIPSSFCGVAGFKPTLGVLSCAGVVPLSRSQDHVGIIGGTVADVTAVWQVLAPTTSAHRGTSRRRVASPDEDTPLANLVVGVADQLSENVDEDVAAAMTSSVAVLQQLGATVERLDLEFLAHTQPVGAVLLAAEASYYHTNALRRFGDEYGDIVRSRLLAGYAIQGVDYVRACNGRARLLREFLNTMNGVDALVCPTTPMTAPPIDNLTQDRQQHEDARRRAVQFTRPFNVLGVPALTVPSGTDRDGLPIGLQIVGKPHTDDVVLGIGSDFERRAAA